MLLLQVLTSKIDKALSRNAENPDLVVVITREDYRDLAVVSAAECTGLIQKTVQEIAEKMRQKELGYFQKDMPAPVLKRIREAIMKSTTISDEQKAYIFDEEEIATRKVK